MCARGLVEAGALDVWGADERVAGAALINRAHDVFARARCAHWDLACGVEGDVHKRCGRATHATGHVVLAIVSSTSPVRRS